MSDPWKLDLPASIVLKAVAPGLRVPESGWHAQTFAEHGRALLKALVRLSRITTKKAHPYVARKAAELFARQINQVCRLVEQRAGRRSAKADLGPVEIELNAHEALWAQAINEVMAEQGIEIVAELVPPIMSVMGQAYNRVSIFMGQAATVAGNQRLARLAQGIASRITQVNDTTRNILNREIRQSIKDGLSVTETAARLRETMPELSRARINTIARTELNQAWTQGSVASFQESETLTHVSVIGCESREEDRWDKPSYQQFMYNGESTCNIEMVPVHDADSLKFHPNHTGTIIPAAFRNEDGSSSEI